MAAAACNASPAVSSFSLSSTIAAEVKGRPRPIYSFPRSEFFRPNFSCNSTLDLSRLKISQKIGIVPVPKHVFRVPTVSCLGDDQSELRKALDNHETVAGIQSGVYAITPLLQERTVDLKLPRRTLLVNFTCNACGERTQKLINRLAYERGTVFVQCAGCFQHHKLIDNLGLVVEFDFRDDSGTPSNADRV